MKLQKPQVAGTSESKRGRGLNWFSSWETKINDEQQIAEKLDSDDESDALQCEIDALREQSNGSDDEFQEKPSQSDLSELFKMIVLDKNRNKTPFKKLIQSTPGQRNIVVFIRHFFCCNCYGYVRALSDKFCPEKLLQLDPPTTLTIVGCGDPVLIPNYLRQTECPFQIYADPSRAIYMKLGFAVNLDPSPVPPKYFFFSQSFMRNLLRSMNLTVRTGKVNAGVISQNGGEMIFVDGELQYMHRMRNTADHTEITDLLSILRRQELEWSRQRTVVHDTDSILSKRSSWVGQAVKRLSAIFDG